MNMPTPADLLPCPFCGGGAELFASSMARCLDCGAEAFGKQWNTRQPAPPKDAEPVAWIDGADIGFLRDGYATRIVHKAQTLPCMVPLYTTPAPSADRRDAERYRWLRENDHASLYRENSTYGAVCLKTHDVLDTAIDAAIARDAQNARKGEEG